MLVLMNIMMVVMIMIVVVVRAAVVRVFLDVRELYRGFVPLNAVLQTEIKFFLRKLPLRLLASVVLQSYVDLETLVIGVRFIAAFVRTLKIFSLNFKTKN